MVIRSKGNNGKRNSEGESARGRGRDGEGRGRGGGGGSGRRGAQEGPARPNTSRNLIFCNFRQIESESGPEALRRARAEGARRALMAVAGRRTARESIWRARFNQEWRGAWVLGSEGARPSLQHEPPECALPQRLPPSPHSALISPKINFSDKFLGERWPE